MTRDEGMTREVEAKGLRDVKSLSFSKRTATIFTPETA